MRRIVAGLVLVVAIAAGCSSTSKAATTTKVFAGDAPGFDSSGSPPPPCASFGTRIVTTAKWLSGCTGKDGVLNPPASFACADGATFFAVADRGVHTVWWGYADKLSTMGPDTGYKMAVVCVGHGGIK